jgi:hypothetical protein
MVLLIPFRSAHLNCKNRNNTEYCEIYLQFDFKGEKKAYLHILKEKIISYDDFIIEGSVRPAKGKDSRRRK